MLPYVCFCAALEGGADIKMKSGMPAIKLSWRDMSHG
jgi:hypothetical protein